MEANKYLKADFLDILFEGKNKNYGAYDLRLSYQRQLAKALIITLILCLATIGAVALSNYLKSNIAKKARLIPKDVVLQEVNVKPHDVPPPPPPPPAPEPPKIKPQVQYTPPKVVEDKMVKPEEQPPNLSQIKNRTISTITQTGDINGIEPALLTDKGTGVTAAPPADEHIFRSVEQMPSFPGGEEALIKYLRDHIHYPAVARENGIQGTIFVQFVVNRDGAIVDVKTVGAKKGGGLEEEATRVVKGMPDWKPGKQNGRSVRVEYNLPIQFRLQ